MYQLGFIIGFSPDRLYLDKSNKVEELIEYYGGSIAATIIKNSRLANISALLGSLIRGQSIHIIGINLKMLALLLPLTLLSPREKITVHLHGQAHGCKGVVKYIIWYLLSKFFSLVVSNPAFAGPDFIKKIKNLNDLGGKKIKLCKDQSQQTIFAASKRGAGRKSFDRFTSLGFNISMDSGLGNDFSSYANYMSAMKQARFMWIGFYDDYYLFSPSGRLSEAAIHSTTVIIDGESESPTIGKLICDAYGVNSLVV